MSATRMIAEWQSFVIKVELGYELTIYDYTNELSTRILLEDEIRSSRLSGDELVAVAALDERFRQATRDSVKPLPGVPRDGGWWVRRVPMNPSGELAEDIRGERL